MKDIAEKLLGETVLTVNTVSERWNGDYLERDDVLLLRCLTKGWIQLSISGNQPTIKTYGFDFQLNASADKRNYQVWSASKDVSFPKVPPVKIRLGKPLGASVQLSILT